MTAKDTIADQYRDHLTRAGKSAHTVRAYTHDLILFARSFEQTTGEGFSPQAVARTDIQEYKESLVHRGLSPATINRRLIALRGFFRWARQEGLAQEDPFEAVRQILVKQPQDAAPRWLDRGEQLALLRAVRKGGNERDLAIIQTLLGTGLRISELAALRVSDLEVLDAKSWLHVRGGRGNKAREIPLDNPTCEALLAYLDGRQEDGFERLFWGQRGPLSEAGIHYLVGKYAYQAKIEGCTSHTLRHTFAKNLVDAGTSLDQVATFLGHESPHTTRVYTRSGKEDRG
jgi:site-specific recombinase XerD